jgi:uncharacterized protein
MKFVNAAGFYKADVLILGGDLTGTLVVPVIRTGAGRYRADFGGERHLLAGEAERADFEGRVRFQGGYPFVLEMDQYQLVLADPHVREELFQVIVCDSLWRWMEILDERLRGTGVRCIVYPGNDDEFWINEILERSTVLENADGRVVDLGRHELIGMGWSNQTPFDSPRELPEDQLELRLQSLIATLRRPSAAIFAFHCPPVNSGLDMAPKLEQRNGQLEAVTNNGATVMSAIGSLAVRNVIERHQPLLGAHGHVHESRSVAKIGRSVCFNPGSEYGKGVLRGALVILEPDRVVSCQLVAA